MSKVDDITFESNMLIYWFDFWTLKSGIGLTINSRLEFYAKPNNAENMRLGSWVEVLTERDNSNTIVRMPPSFIYETKDFESYEMFKDEIGKKSRRDWTI